MAGHFTDTTSARQQREAHPGSSISIVLLGQALSAFFVVSYTLCIVGYLLFPGVPVTHEALAIFLPGFALLNWYTFFLGLIESFIWGWYIALVFGAIYNFFLHRMTP